jgi:excisionase family DNA binding protein
MKKVFLTVKEICRVTGLSDREIKNFIYQKKLKAINPGGRKLLIPIESFEQFFDIKIPDDWK